MMVGEHGIQTVKLVVIVLLLSFDIFIPASAHPLFIWTKWFVQIYVNVSLGFSQMLFLLHLVL